MIAAVAHGKRPEFLWQLVIHFHPSAIVSHSESDYRPNFPVHTVMREIDFDALPITEVPHVSSYANYIGTMRQSLSRGKCIAGKNILPHCAKVCYPAPHLADLDPLERTENEYQEIHR